MPAVRKIDVVNTEGTDFAPSEMYVIVLDQNEAKTLCKLAIRWNVGNEFALRKIFAGSFCLLNELLD